MNELQLQATMKDRGRVQQMKYSVIVIFKHWKIKISQYILYFILFYFILM
jgi:hypothetical protein